MSHSSEQKAWIISVNMGYGHQRTAFPLKSLAPEGKIINANDYEGISKKDRRIWEGSRSFYEFISNFKRIPLIGNFVFSLFDTFQRILGFYPKRDLSKPNAQLKETFAIIKAGWGKDLIEELILRRSADGQPLPLISTFFIPVFMAEFFKYPAEIFCVVCDADISRTWASLNSKESKIKYFAPTERVVERLKLYGVKEENIFLTGFPLPKELIGTEEMEILKEDVKYRLVNLDPERRHFEKYKVLIEKNLGKLPSKPDHPLTILFSVGGAGAQKEMAIRILKSLRKEIQKGRIKIIFSAGIKKEIRNYFLKKSEVKKGMGLDKPGVEILFGENIEDYFQKFNLALRKTDVLWTKPSELSFYAALGLPIIIAPPIGSQEEFNMRWLLKSGFGLKQENPIYTGEWFFDWLLQGYLAEAAFEGFLEGQKLGTYNIQKIISKL